MLKVFTVFALLVGFVIGSAPASSPERFAKVRAMTLEALEKSGIPSISIAAAEDGKIVWQESFGYAEKESRPNLKKVRFTMTVTALPPTGSMKAPRTA